MRTSRIETGYRILPTAEKHLRKHKSWSLENFGKATTTRYFQDLTKGFDYIAQHYSGVAERPELTGESGLCIYPIREHYAVFTVIAGMVYIVAVVHQSRHVQAILDEEAALYHKEVTKSRAALNSKTSKSRAPKKP